VKAGIVPETLNPEEVKGIHYGSGKPIAIEIRDGLINSVVEISKDSEDDFRWYIAPGLIDNQVNGYSGVDFSGDDLTKEKLKKATEEIWRDGVTTFIPVIVSGSKEKTLKNLKILSESVDDEFFMNSIPGFHLEGPYLSTEPGFYGCHQLKYLRRPSWKEFTDFQMAARGKIIEITIAPELEGAIAFIKKCHESGIIISIGHTSATAEQISLAEENGAVLSTHLGNGCANMIHRHVNPIWPQLASEKLTASVIADGHHLLPEELKVFYKAKGENKLILISDVTHFIGMEPGEYDYMGNSVSVNRDGLVMIPELNCLAGASMPLKKGIETMIRCTGCTTVQAFNLAGRNAAKVLGLSDRGTLDPGKRADLILFEFNGKEIVIRKTIVKGKLVYSC
jgi:N-acetylglucosamine-6-phosphate deacetylase